MKQKNGGNKVVIMKKFDDLNPDNFIASFLNKNLGKDHK